MSRSSTTDLVVVGAGIVGLAHAWAAARQGKSVRVFDRSSRAEGASIRNFGMIWPIGQPAGTCHATALRTRELWLKLREEAGIWVNACGSIHLAHRPDEWAVLEEFAQRAPALGYSVELMTPQQVLDASPASNPKGLLGGLWSSTELCVDPREAIGAIANWLADQHGIEFHFNTLVRAADGTGVETADGRRFTANRSIICSGADFETLFPHVLAASGLRRCKLQMLRTEPQPDGWRIGPHLASGLTLRHYRNFEVCDSLAAVKRRIAEESPELDRYGIHVMVSQNQRGEAILGDSHEYGEAMSPFDKAEIDKLMLRELQAVFRLPNWTIAQHWSGIYAKHASAPQFVAEPVPGASIVTATGGAGMTMSFGLAEENWRRWNGDA
jgi:FAD dependent oxidoreductase TIGR03364